MGKPVLLILSHSIEEHDQVALLSGLGYDVFSLGGYIDPAHPHDDKRPALPDAPRHPELQAVVDALGMTDNIGAAARAHPRRDPRLARGRRHHHRPPLPRGPHLPAVAAPARLDARQRAGGASSGGRSGSRSRATRGGEPLPLRGARDRPLQPRRARIPGYAGEDALIRFWADTALYDGWTGEARYVGNVTQHLWQRGPGRTASSPGRGRGPARPCSPGRAATPGPCRARGARVRGDARLPARLPRVRLLRDAAGVATRSGSSRR